MRPGAMVFADPDGVVVEK
ncbi:MAG: hypothetical protein L0K12_03370 [Brevibacterium aurantiacum]|nr:hypothetical protein [Brevibacterium aurantiacum]